MKEFTPFIKERVLNWTNRSKVAFSTTVSSIHRRISSPYPPMLVAKRGVNYTSSVVEAESANTGITEK